MSRVRDFVAAVVAVILVIVLAAGILMALGKPVPIIGNLLGTFLK